MTSHRWTTAAMPDLSGRTALVTGVTSGIGEHTVLELARHGAAVVLAARSEEKLRRTVDDVRRVLPGADLGSLVVDLADLASVRRAADQVVDSGRPLDILVNNAGVMATPYRRTVDGFELQLGTNHLGHFALTGLLFERLAKAEAARVVTVSSQMHRVARSVPPDLARGPRGYRKWQAYAESKLANLLFALELDRRARAAGTPVVSVAAHPGYAATNLMHAGLDMDGRAADGTILQAATRVLAQPAAMGAEPTLMAATLPGLPGGSYVGPGGFGEMRGSPRLVTPSRAARDVEQARRLWAASEAATGVTFP